MAKERQYGLADGAAGAVLPEVGYLRLWQIIGDRKHGIPPIVPVSKSQWYNGMRSGLYPKPVKIGPRIVVWRVADIKALIQSDRG